MVSNRFLDSVQQYLDAERKCERAWLTGAAPEGPRRDLDAAEHRLQHELAAEKARHLQFSHILVAIDTNPRAAWALHTAAAMAVALDAQLRIVHVVNPGVAINNEYGLPDPDLVRTMHRQAEEFLRAVASRLPREPSDLVVREGDPGEEIVADARDWPADVLVLAAPCHGQFLEFLTGSAAEYVLRHAPCPVMTVCQPPTAAAEHAESEERQTEKRQTAGT